MKTSIITLALTGFLLGGCAFDLGYGLGFDIDVPVEAVEAPPMVRIAPQPGKYLLIIQGDALAARLSPSDYDCNAEAIVYDLREAFAESVRRTVAPTVSALETGDRMLSPEELKAGGFAGQIVVNPDPPATDLAFERRFWFDRKHFAEFWHHASTAQLDLSAAVYVQSVSGEVLETRVAAERRYRNPDGLEFACDNAVEALSQVASDALKDFTRELATRLVGFGRGGERWLTVTEAGPGSVLARALSDRTFDLHSVTGEPRGFIDYFDRNWRFVRRDGLCEKVGRWSVARDGGGESLCIEIPGEARACYRVDGLPDAPAYLPLSGDDLRPVGVAWRARPGNAENFRLDIDHCKGQMPY